MTVYDSANTISKIFERILDNLRTESKNKAKFDDAIQKFSKYPCRYKRMSDNEVYFTLVQVVFYSGMRAKTVDKKMHTIRKYFGDFKKAANYREEDIKRMLNDENMLKNERKIRACIHNAKQFIRIIKAYGSFANYLDSFNVSCDDVNGIEMKLKPALMGLFERLGEVTIYHYLMDLGFEVMKPDTTIRRLFYRLGWLDSPEETSENIEMTIRICRGLSEDLGIPIRVVDIVLVTFCQEGGNKEFGVERGICTKTPQCEKCWIKDYCKHYILSVK